jgi:superfamily I DNA and RNA helicase
VIDEGQDFKTDWYEMVSFFLEEGATQLWLEDPLQKLRHTDPVDLPTFVTYRETSNFRTPASIASFIKGTLATDFSQRNAMSGLGVGLHEYENPVDIQKILNERAIDLVKQGFAPSDITIVSVRGMGSTSLDTLAQVGKWKVRRFSGKYDVNSQQVYTDGDINFESIYRYKGEQAPVVILVDLDERLEHNDWNTGVLYCAMTRATVRLELVVQKGCPWVETFRENL